MKLMEVTEKRIGEYSFYLKPFPAFVAANISGELAAILTPMLGSFASLIGNGNDESADDVEKSATEKVEDSFMDMDMEKAGPAIANAFSGLSGDRFEKIMKKLLIDNKNISVEGEATDGQVKLLTYDLANEVFCGELQDMYSLCFEVIRLNFGGFFKKLGVQFGSLRKASKSEAPSTKNGETSI